MLSLRGKFLQSGLSLVELMIALTLGSLLTAGIITLSVNSSQTSRSLNTAGQQLENGRYAINTLKGELQHAGYFGELIPCYPLNPPPAYTSISNAFSLCVPFATSPPQANVLVPEVLPDPCDLNSGVVGTILTNLANGFVVPLTGYDKPASSPIPCLIPDGDFANGTDILVLRRAATECPNRAQSSSCSGLVLGPPFGESFPLTPGTVYLQTGYDGTSNNGYVIGLCTSAKACIGVKSTGFGTPPVIPALVSGDPATVFSLLQKNPAGGADLSANIRTYEVHIYFIRPWSSDPAETPRIPTLARKVLAASGNAPAMTTEALIEGIENLQIQYGIDDGTAPGVAYDGTADRYTAAPASTVDWSNVVTARVSLLARRRDPDIGFTDAKTYDIGEGSFRPGGNFQRHVFSNVIRLNNVAGRRECPSTPVCN